MTFTLIEKSQVELQKWSQNKETTKIALWRGRKIFIMKANESLLVKIAWWICSFLGLLQESGPLMEEIKTFYVEKRVRSNLEGEIQDLMKRRNQLAKENEAEMKALAEELKQARLRLDEAKAAADQLISDTDKLKAQTDSLAPKQREESWEQKHALAEELETLRQEENCFGETSQGLPLRKLYEEMKRVIFSDNPPADWITQAGELVEQAHSVDFTKDQGIVRKFPGERASHAEAFEAFLEKLKAFMREVELSRLNGHKVDLRT